MAERNQENVESELIEHELQGFAKEWWWFLLLGITLVLMGGAAIVYSCAFTTVSVTLFGVLMLVAGAQILIGSFWTGKWSGFLIHLLLGVMYTVVGFLVIDSPDAAAAGLTLLIAAFFVVGGLFRIVAALAMRFSNWGWVLLNGLVSVVLGVMINESWPASGEWVIGLFVGIEMLFHGVTWIAMSLSLHRAGEVLAQRQA